MKIIKASEGWHQAECSMNFEELDLWQDDDYICLNKKQVRELYNFLRAKLGKNKNHKQKKLK